MLKSAAASRAHRFVPPGLGKGKNVTIRREIFRQDNAQTDESTFRIDGEWC